MAQESILRIVIDSRNAERNARNIARELQNIERNGDYASRSMDSMSVATRQLAGYMAGIVTVGAAISKMDAYTGLQNRLKLVTDSQTELNTAMNDTFAIAQKTASSWDSVAMVYQRFADNADRLGISMKQTAALTETVSKAISVSGGSAASAEAALMQFGQALASGVLRGEEFNSIAEQAPGLLKAIAMGMDTNIGSLRAMAAEGKVTGDALVEALSKAKPYIDDLFNKTDFTISQSFTQLSNEVTKFVGEAGKGSGAASALSGSISTLAENLELIADGAFVVGIGYITKAIATKTVAVYSSIAATTASIEAEKVAAAQTLRSALAEKTAAEAELTRARDAVVSAEMQVQADRKVIASEMQRIESSLAQVAAEKQLEIQRLKSQINDQGRIATSTRMAELQQVQASMTAELTVLERQLGATTVASSAQFVAAREAQVVATGNLAATTEVATVAQAQNNAVQRAGLLTSTGLVGALGGPLGLGITVAALAATYLMFKDSSDDVNDSLSSQIEVVSDLAQKYRELTLAKLISEQDALEKKLKNSESQSSKAIASLMGVATAIEYSTDKQKKQSEEMNRIATSLRDGAITTGKALIQMRESGFTEAQIKKASAFFDEFDKGKAGAAEAARQIDYVSQQTGIYGDKLDASTKKIADQKAIVNALSGDYKNLSDEMGKNIDWLLQQDGALSATAEQQKKVTDAVDAWKKGTIDATSVAKVFKANLPIDSSLLTGLDGLATKTDKAKKELNTANGELKQVQANGPKAKQGFKDTADGAKNSAEQVALLNKELADYNKGLQDREFDAVFTKNLLAKKFTEGEINALLEAANAAREKGLVATEAMYRESLRIYRLEKGNKDTIDSRNAAERERTKELEKQQKVLQVNAKVKANAAKYNFTGLESKYGLPSGTLSAIHAIETGNTGKSNQVNSQTGATGGFQFLEGTAKQYGVKDRTDLAQSAEGAAKYMSYLLKLFKGDLEKAVRAYHAGEGNVQKGKNIGKYNNDYWQKFKGYTAGTNGFTAGDVGSKDWEKLLEEAAKMAEQQAELRKNLELNVADEVTRIRSKLADDLQEIDKAGYSPERAKEIKAEYQTRADNDIAIAEYALRTKLDDYKDFQKSEEELLRDSFDQRKFYAARDIELTKRQRNEAVQLLEKQYQHELALILLANEERLFQTQQMFISETAAMEERYRLERERIRLNMKLTEEQKQREITLSRALEAEEKRRSLNRATQQWGQINAEMTGTSEQWRLNQERFTRMDASQEVFDTEMSQADQAAQDPNANMQEIAAQREAIWQAHHDRMTAIESDYYYNSQALQLAGMGQIASGLASIVGDMAGEQSSAYKAMFAIEKGFAIAQSALAIQTGVSKAIALGFPQNIPVIAQTVMEGAKITSAIKSITDTGFSSGGYTGPGGKYDIAGTVHKGEVVFSQEDVARWGGPSNVESLRKSSQREFKQTELVQGGTNVVAMQPKVTINNYSSEKVETSTNQDGELMVTIGKMLDQKIDSGVDRGIQRNLRQGYPLANAIKGR